MNGEWLIGFFIRLLIVTAKAVQRQIGTWKFTIAFSKPL
jgi:uncharacterized protein YwlG (UPF0340 family)